MTKFLIVISVKLLQEARKRIRRGRLSKVLKAGLHIYLTDDVHKQRVDEFIQKNKELV